MSFCLPENDNALRFQIETQILQQQNVFEKMAKEGHFIMDNFLPESFANSLLAEVKQLETNKEMIPEYSTYPTEEEEEELEEVVVEAKRAMEPPPFYAVLLTKSKHLCENQETGSVEPKEHVRNLVSYIRNVSHSVPKSMNALQEKYLSAAATSSSSQQMSIPPLYDLIINDTKLEDIQLSKKKPSPPESTTSATATTEEEAEEDDDFLEFHKIASCSGHNSFLPRHLDNNGLYRSDVRKLTCILYLVDKEHWSSEKYGGQLRLHIYDRNVHVDVEPQFNRFVMFWSDYLVHEVLPTSFQGDEALKRYTITIWLRTHNPREYIQPDKQMTRRIVLRHFYNNGDM